MEAAAILKILAIAAANAPAAIQTFGQLKNAVVQGIADFKGAFDDDTPLDELRAGALKDMDDIKATSEQIQTID